MKAKTPSDRTIIRRLRLSVKERDLRIDALKLQLHDAHTRLFEARRRTIPLNDGTDLNFLPISLSQVKIRRDVKELHNAAGFPISYATGKAEVTITAEGDLIQFAAPPARRAED